MDHAEQATWDQAHALLTAATDALDGPDLAYAAAVAAAAVLAIRAHGAAVRARLARETSGYADAARAAERSPALTPADYCPTS